MHENSTPASPVTVTIEIPAEEFDAATSPSDLKGRINLRVESALQQEIEDIAENRNYPLRSVSEVVRFCCLMGIDRLRRWKPQSTLMGAIRAGNALAVRDRLQSEAMDLLKRMEERVEWHIANGSYDEAINLTGQIRAHFDAVPDGFWKEHIVNEIDRKFDEWLAVIDSKRAN